MKKIEVLPCQCGLTAEVGETGGKLFYVECQKAGCWRGPLFRKRSRAVKKWNRLMVVAGISRDLEKKRKAWVKAGYPRKAHAVPPAPDHQID